TAFLLPHCVKMRQHLLTFLALLALLLVNCRAAEEEYENVPFLNPVKRSFNRVVLRPIDFLHHKRMVSFSDTPGGNALLESLMNARRY
ncbi:hypothetical protein PENTCL1PPCAC_28758, partial [Pristionchus entomophagus]